MKLYLVKVGKAKTSETRALVEMYLERTKTLAQVLPVELRDSDAETLKTLLSRIPNADKSGSHLVVLDERGKEWTSVDFAKQIKKWNDDPAIKQIAFVIGGPYGLPDEVRKAAHLKWSLSKGTLPSDLAWLVAAEQIYRALTILKGTSYHHGD